MAGVATELRIDLADRSLGELLVQLGFDLDAVIALAGHLDAVLEQH